MKYGIKALIIGLVIFAATHLHAESLINCQNGGSASVGDLKQEVRLSCGEPERTEIIGYIDQVKNEDRIRVMKIEEWIYSTSYYGERYYFSLEFEGNKLVKIEKIGKK